MITEIKGLNVEITFTEPSKLYLNGINAEVTKLDFQRSNVFSITEDEKYYTIKGIHGAEVFTIVQIPKEYGNVMCIKQGDVILFDGTKHIVYEQDEMALGTNITMIFSTPRELNIHDGMYEVRKIEFKNKKICVTNTTKDGKSMFRIEKCIGSGDRKLLTEFPHNYMPGFWQNGKPIGGQSYE